MEKDLKIGFVGLGKLGMPCAEVFAEFHTVTGYDIADRKSNAFKVVGQLSELVAASDIVFISVPTPHEKGYDGSAPSSHLEPRDFDYSYVVDSLAEINRYCRPDQLIVLISTVLPGTIRNQLKPALSNAQLIYNPYLIAMGTVKADLKKPEMVIIGNASGNRDAGIDTLTDLYKEISGADVRIAFGTWEEAESIKIFYNTFISAKIGLVNMIQDVAEKLGHMDVGVVTDALMESTYRIMGPAYMKAGLGDGGPCHPRDNIALRYLAQEIGLEYDLFGTIMKSREVQAKHLADRCASFDNPVVILGTSYKPNVQLTDGSYALLVGHYLETSGQEVYYDTPPAKDGPFTYVLCHEGRFNDHPFEPGSTIVDPWRSFKTRRDDLNIYWYGNSKKHN